MKTGRGKRSDCLYMKILLLSPDLLLFFFGVKVPYYIILLYIVICTLSVFLVICRQYDSY